MNAIPRPTMAVTSELWSGAVKRQADAFEDIANAVIQNSPTGTTKEMVSSILEFVLALNETTEIQGSTYGFNLYEQDKLSFVEDRIATLKASLEDLAEETRNNLYELMETYGYTETDINVIKDLLPEYEESSRVCGYAAQVMDII